MTMRAWTRPTSEAGERGGWNRSRPGASVVGVTEHGVPEVSRLADEQAALRRVATLVARASSPEEVFAAVTEEAARVLDTEAVGMLRFEADGTATLVAQSLTPWDPPPLGTRFTLEGANVVVPVLRTGQAARLDDWSKASGSVAAMARALGIRSSVATPIVVEGTLWGAMIAVTSQSEPLPADTESRIAEFTELVATTIANAQARGDLSRLADEQSALRRVATLVAEGSSPTEVFDAVAEEVGRLLGVASTGLLRFESDETVTLVAGWGRFSETVRVGTRLALGGANVTSEIARTGRPARYDPGVRATGAVGEHARRLDVRAAAGSPIVVAGRLWGAMTVAAVEGGPLPLDVEPRLAQFTQLVATAIANAEARVELARLADEQAALRRVATLVAGEAPAAELFAKVAEEVANVLGPRIDSAILRYEADDSATVMAVFGQQPPGGIRMGRRLPVNGSGITAKVHREKRPVRMDEYAAADGAIADDAREHGIRSAVGCPIVVQGRLWGAMVVAHYDDEPFASDTERRVSQFTNLVATAIANAEARGEVQRLADEQAALRRVATLVAEGAARTAVFDAVLVEVAQLLGAAQVGLMRSEGSQEIAILAQRGQDPAVVRPGTRLPLDGDSVTARVLRTGRSARLDRYDQRRGTIADIAHRSKVSVTVGAPIVVEGARWGVITASWEEQGPPVGDAEERLTEFAQLLGTAIANAESRDELEASRARVLSAGDEARRRVVRDLHDGAQQRLVHAVVALKLAQRAFDTERGRAESLLAEALDHAERGNAELRELAHGILPAVLTRGGLRAGIDSLVSRLGLPVDLDVTSTQLPPEIEANAYFIVAEALNNVMKHSQAARAQVTAAVRSGMLSVEVRDDGVGGADPEGHGLVGLSDRVAALGGRLRIDSPQGAGTVLAAELPMPA
jgi:signal transduction histidine kinase